MAVNLINGIDLIGTELQQLLMCDSIVPGSQPGYQTCKTIYTHHPHGAKIVDFPVQMAQYKPRQITVAGAPDDGKMWVDAFNAEWKAMAAEKAILNLARMSRMYGISTLGLLQDGVDPSTELDVTKLANAKIALNCWDPLNTAGSLVLDQNPLSMNFQKIEGVRVAGQVIHKSRCCVMMNEAPLYIVYQDSSYGFSGRSVYQRGLVPLKSFIFTLATNMMIAVKAGVLIAKMKSQSSAVDAPMQWLFGGKRALVKEAQVGNVISIDVEEDIESLNLQNLDGAYSMGRKFILEDEAAACGCPAKILLAETFAEGFGEGTEDANAIAQYIETVRNDLQPGYDFLDPICQRRAWTEEFYERCRAKYPKEYGSLSFTAAFQEAKNSFKAEWPNLREEPEIEKLKGEDVVLKAIISVVEIILPAVPPEVKSQVIGWMQNELNERKRLFSSHMELDLDAIAEFDPAPAVGGEDGEKAPPEPKPESSAESAPKPARRMREKLDAVDDEVRRMAAQGLKLVQGHAAGGGGLV